MPVNNDEIVEDILRPIDEAIQSEGFTPKYRIKCLKQHTKAKTIQITKMKGKVKPESLKPGYRIVAESDEETLIAHRVNDYNTQRMAIKEVCAIAGDYPGPKAPDGEGQWTISLNFGGKKNEEE